MFPYRNQYHEGMNVLEYDIYGGWANFNDPDGASAKSWKRAFRYDNEYTPIRKCPCCGIRKTPKKMSHEFASCFSCANKIRGLKKRIDKYIIKSGNGDKKTGYGRALAVLLVLLEDIDASCFTWNKEIDDILANQRIHCSLIDSEYIDLRKNVFSELKSSYLSTSPITVTRDGINLGRRLDMIRNHDYTWRDVRSTCRTFW